MNGLSHVTFSSPKGPAILKIIGLVVCHFMKKLQIFVSIACMSALQPLHLGSKGNKNHGKFGKCQETLKVFLHKGDFLKT